MLGEVDVAHSSTSGQPQDGLSSGHWAAGKRHAKSVPPPFRQAVWANPDELLTHKRRHHPICDKSTDKESFNAATIDSRSRCRTAAYRCAS